VDHPRSSKRGDPRARVQGVGGRASTLAGPLRTLRKGLTRNRVTDATVSLLSAAQSCLRAVRLLPPRSSLQGSEGDLLRFPRLPDFRRVTLALYRKCPAGSNRGEDWSGTPDTAEEEMESGHAVLDCPVASLRSRNMCSWNWRSSSTPSWSGNL